MLAGGDALVRLNDAFLPDAVVLDVPAGVVLEAPIVVVHWCDGAETPGGRRWPERRQGPASFPRTAVRLGRGAEASVVEVVAGAPGDQRALVVPVTELAVDDGGDLSYVVLQVLGTGAWHIGRLAARVGRDATLRTFTVGLGGAYDRSRTDAAAAGPGAPRELRSAYLGTGDQVHDIRTLQDHQAPRTTSDLLCKGAVAGSSRSVYSGLIRVRHGAVRTEAIQTNHNLVLDERAHADSVPNLDIEENDVRCSHASTVGPVDEDQRYYLESRGVPPDRAERLIVLGFFDDIVERSRCRRWWAGCAARSASGWPTPSIWETRRREETAMGERVVLCRRQDLAPGKVRRFDGDAYRIALVRIGDDFYAIGDRCSHEDYSLSEGEVWVDECEIECPQPRQHLRSADRRGLHAAGHQAGARLRGEVDGDDVTVVLP